MNPSDSFAHFRSTVALQQRVVRTREEHVWKYYDHGDRKAPILVCLPGASGTAASFYKQLLALTAKGVRVISIQYPPYWSHEAWARGFDRFLDELNIDKIHIYGRALGGFLAQYYTVMRPRRVASLVLTNTFYNTQYFKEHAPPTALFQWMPAFYLKKIMLQNFPQGMLEPEIADSVDFMVRQLEGLKQSELASRLTLNCSAHQIRNLQLESSKITIVDTMDTVAVPQHLRDELYAKYPDAKLALLKTGGNFPYLSRADEVNMHIIVHLRNQGVLDQPTTSVAGDDTAADGRESGDQKTKSPAPARAAPTANPSKDNAPAADDDDNDDDDDDNDDNDDNNGGDDDDAPDATATGDDDTAGGKANGNNSNNNNNNTNGGGKKKKKKKGKR